MKEIEVTKKMYETIDGKLFETAEEAKEHELNLEYHKDIISFARNIKKMCYKYMNHNGDEECNPKCPFKYGENICLLDDYPCNWLLPTV